VTALGPGAGADLPCYREVMPRSGVPV